MTKSDAEGGREKISDRRQQRHPARGKRYSSSLKKEILVYAQDNGVESAAGKHGVTATTIYEWRRAAARRGNETGKLAIEEQDPKVERDRRVLAMWRQHPGYGPSQVRNMLKRGGFPGVGWYGAPCDGRKWLPSSDTQAQGACRPL